MAKSSDNAASINRAMEVFVRGYSFTRSFTHPYHPQQMAQAWVVRDTPRKRGADYRREEWVGAQIAPAELDALARENARGHFCICAIVPEGQNDGPLRAAYKSLGYRLGTSEFLMAHRLKSIPKFPEPFPIERVLSADLADRLTKSAGQRQILPVHLHADAPLRQYVALDNERPTGWVRSIAVDDATWVSNMHVLPKYRRRGIGKSLLARMLRDDRKLGSKVSVLMASHAGAMLYPVVGYEMLGKLLVYTPIRRLTDGR
ncbi:MAG TPA: GNAT family N-acetyltransferase [Humisphaera sp.]|nr:GNAT family N-acetyltransferase [Humisphaera sp.]